MRFSGRALELPPRWRWHTSRLANPLYRSAFGSFGEGTVIVRPHILRGVERIHLGARVALYDGVWLACEDGQGPITIGDDTYLGHRVHLHAGARISIGTGCHLVDDVYIGTADHDRAVRALSVATSPISIGDDVFVGQRAIILGGVTIGDHATIGAGAVVTHDVPDGATVAGVPARVIE